MINFLDKHILFLAKMFSSALLGMTFMLGFSRMTTNYEISLAYIAIGFACIMWTLYKFFERGVGGGNRTQII